MLVVDNGGRTDHACIGDLVVAEAKAAGVAGVLVWGLHRDSADILAIGLPVFSLGAIPTGPLELAPRDSQALLSARVGEHTVGTGDVVLADDDGAVFMPGGRVAEILDVAEGIRGVERRQAERIRGGNTLREQVDFASFRENRKADRNRRSGSTCGPSPARSRNDRTQEEGLPAGNSLRGRVVRVVALAVLRRSPIAQVLNNGGNAMSLRRVARRE